MATGALQRDPSEPESLSRAERHQKPACALRLVAHDDERAQRLVQVLEPYGRRLKRESRQPPGSGPVKTRVVLSRHEQADTEGIV